MTSSLANQRASTANYVIDEWLKKIVEPANQGKVEAGKDVALTLTSISAAKSALHPLALATGSSETGQESFI